MGNASSHTYNAGATPHAVDARVILQHDLPKFIYVDQLANGKFIKSYKCKVDGVAVVVKVYIKRDPLEDLREVEESLSRLVKVLDPQGCPNVLPYQRWLQSTVRASQHRGAGTPAYLIRQHLLGTLRDRLSTRPFLTSVEKRWMVYQLLCATAQCHERGVCHGDIKSKNVLVTSCNWLLLTDFAPFKPTYLPDDHPADANYYFTSGEQGRCYLAPERLRSAGGGGVDGGVGGAEGLRDLDACELSPTLPPRDKMTQDGLASGGGSKVIGQGQLDSSSEVGSTASGVFGSGGNGAEGGGRGRVGGGLKESMDVFSLGCVIAEIFLGGEALLDLPGLLHYRNSGDMEDRMKKLRAVGQPVVQRLVQHMVQRDAGQRKSVK
ncbi:unnamed protein product, partial [Choristocarpus tenellus]